MLSAGIRSTSEASRRWYCRCQGVQGFGCPQQLRRQRLIIQQIEISHIYQHQSRLGIFVHSEVETRLVFDKDTALCHILDQTSLGLRIDREQERSISRQLPRLNSA